MNDMHLRPRNAPMPRFRRILFALVLGLVAGAAWAASLPPIRPVAHVDLPRFMGKWYLIATIPTSYGKDAYNAIETYGLQPDGNIHTTFTFHDGSFDGPVKHLESTGYVKAGTGNAEWSVKLFWFLRAQYIVAYLKPDYSEMIVARDKRDYAWVFARTPEVSPSDYQTLVGEVRDMGYPMAKLRRVPQRWPGTATTPAQTTGAPVSAEQKPASR